VVVPGFSLELVSGEGPHLSVGPPVVQGQRRQVVEGLLQVGLDVGFGWEAMDDLKKCGQCLI
jgi:hypothetical protein